MSTDYDKFNNIAFKIMNEHYEEKPEDDEASPIKGGCPDTDRMDEEASRQHYAKLANILKDAQVKFKSNEAADVLDYLVEKIIEASKDKESALYNPNFNDVKFREVAGIMSLHVKEEGKKEDVVGVMNKKTGIKFKQTKNSMGKE